MGIVSKVTWQPDFVQKDVIVHGKRKKLLIELLIVLFVGKLYIVNFKLPKESGVSATALASATSLLSLVPFLLMW